MSLNINEQSSYKYKAKTGYTYYNSKNPVTGEETALDGYLFKTNVESSDAFNRNLINWWHFNLGVTTTGGKYADEKTYIDESHLMFNYGLDFGLRKKISSLFSFGPFAGYQYQYTNHRGYYEEYRDTDNNGLIDTLYYTGPDYKQTLREHNLRGGLDIRAGDIRLLGYYGFNPRKYSYSKLGLAFSLPNTFLEPELKVNFNQNLSRFLGWEFNLAIYSIFILGLSYTKYNDKKIPPLYTVEVGATLTR